jgi:hypothetical protein
VALISHSGSTWSGIVGNLRGMRFNTAISAGQELATGVALLLLASWWVAHWRKQNRVKAVENHPAVR